MTDQPIEPTIIIEDESLRQGFTLIPNALLRRTDITPGAKLTYMVLLSYAWQEGSCFPGQERMAEDMGVTSRSVRTYLQQLETTGLIVVKQRGLGQTNIYHLPRFQVRPENISAQDRKETTHQEVKIFPTKKTQVEKNSDPKNPEIDSSNIRKVPTEKNGYDDARLTLLEYVSDLSIEFLDTASVGASTSRAVNLYARAGFSLDDFINAMIDARAITKERTASIKRRTKDGDKSKMAYFFTVLEDRLGLKAG